MYSLTSWLVSPDNPFMTTLILITVFVTSLLSGVLGMGGGLILMGVLAALLPVPEAMLLHGAAQLMANGSRAAIGREHAAWRLMPVYALGTFVGLALFTAIQLVPPAWLIFLLLGILPFLALKLKTLAALDIRKKSHAAAAGLLVNAVQLLAGASGPVLDVFFLKADMKRHEVVATKAMTQTFAHLVKLIYFGGIAAAAATFATVSWPLVLAVLAMALAGTVVGQRVLGNITDKKFQQMTRALVLGIGAVFLVRGAWLLAGT